MLSVGQVAVSQPLWDDLIKKWLFELSLRRAQYTRAASSPSAIRSVAGGLYSETALRKTGGEATVYPKEQELNFLIASKQTPQATQVCLLFPESRGLSHA